MDPLSTNSTKKPERWLMLAIMWFSYFCFGLVSASLAPLVTPIMHDLGLSDGQMGLILGTWQLVYIGTAYLLGSLVDRFGLRHSVTMGIVIMGLSLVARSMATSFLGLFLAVALFGMGAPIISAGAPKVVSLWFDGGERGVASGIYSTAPVSGNTVALAVGGSLIIPLTGSWRGIGLVYGVVLASALLLWILLARDPVGADAAQRQPRPPKTAEVLKNGRGNKGPSAFSELLSIRNVQIIMVIALGTLLTNHGLNNWLPTFLHDKSMTLAQAGLWSAGATAAGIAGGLLIPGLTAPGKRPQVMSGIFIVVSLTLLGIVGVNGVGLGVAILMFGFARQAIMPIAHVLMMETPGVGSKRMGAATGMYFTFGEIGGFSGPFLLGVIRHVSGSLSWGLVFLAAFGLVMAVLPWFIRTQESGRTGVDVNA